MGGLGLACTGCSSRNESLEGFFDSMAGQVEDPAEHTEGSTEYVPMGQRPFEKRKGTA
ncbi:MAG: hypothetical protein CM15mV74_100 [uncultured marine virus]|nr:MAG: hypothetical protein CM15mV74_100 [uncultured marine virus]